jgi:hypothetical protein
VHWHLHAAGTQSLEPSPLEQQVLTAVEYIQPITRSVLRHIRVASKQEL